MPNLSAEALRKRIKDRALGPLHVFVGEDAVLIDRLVDAVEGTVDEADRPFAVERLYAGEEGGAPLDIAAAARVLPMLGDRRIVIVLRAERLLKPKRGKGASAEVDDDGATDATPEAADAAPLEDYIASPADSTTLLFVAAGMDRTRRLVKQLIKAAEVTEFEGLSADRPAERRQMKAAAAALVDEELRQAGRAIEPGAARLLVERAGQDIGRLRNDLNRVLLFTEGRPKVTLDDVAEIVSSDVPVEDDWGIVNALGDGDAARALSEAGRRIDRGDSPHALLGQLRWWVSTRLVEADATRVKPALDALLRTDLALKSSGGDHRVLIERLVVELSGRPLPPRRGGRWG